jgi:hypothetical protein
VVDFYLSEEHERERVEVLELVTREEAASEELLLGYVREALRLNPPVRISAPSVYLCIGFADPDLFFFCVVVCWAVALCPRGRGNPAR